MIVIGVINYNEMSQIQKKYDEKINIYLYWLSLTPV